MKTNIFLKHLHLLLQLPFQIYYWHRKSFLNPVRWSMICRSSGSRSLSLSLLVLSNVMNQFLPLLMLIFYSDGKDLSKLKNI